jgi:MFS family permease
MAVLALLGEGFFSRLSFGLISLALPLYARQLGMSLTHIGILVSLSAVVSAVGRPLMGRIAARYGLRRTLLAGMGLRSLVTLLLAACWLPWHLFGIKALHGMADSARKPAVDSLLAQAGGRKKAASVFAWYSTARAMAASIGRAAAGMLLAVTAGHFGPVFVLAFVLSALPLLVVWICVKEPPALEPQPEEPPQPVAEEAAADSLKLLPIVSLGALMSGTAEMLRGLFPILATEYAGLSPAQTGMIYLASTMVTMAAGPLFGWLSDHVNRELVLLIRSAANILSSAIYLFSPTFPGVLAARMTDDVGKAAFRPAWGAMMTQASSPDPRIRARQMGVLGMGEDIGELLGPIVAGLLLSSGGLVALMGTRMALAAATEAYAVFVTRRLQASERPQPASAPAPQGPLLDPRPAVQGTSAE